MTAEIFRSGSFAIAHLTDGQTQPYSPDPSIEYAAPETAVEANLRFACGDSAYGLLIDIAPEDHARLIFDLHPYRVTVMSPRSSMSSAFIAA